MIWPDPTHYAPTQPPTHQTLHPHMGGRVSTDCKSINGIEIFWFVQVLLNFFLILQSYPLGVGVGGWGWGWVCEEVSHACMHAYTHARMHTHTHMHAKHHKHGCLHVGSHLQFLYMYTCLHTCACAHVWQHPHAPRPPTHPPAHSPEPQGAQNTKIQ